MKKYAMILISTLLLFGLILPIGAAQNGKMVITPDKAEFYPGATVTFTVKVTGVSAAKSIGIIPQYDTSVFELVSGEWLVTGAALSDFSGGTATIAYASPRAFNENVFRLKLKVKSSAKLGSYNVTANTNIKNGTEEIATTVTAGKITVVCNHSYSKWTSISGSQHNRTCSKCKDQQTKSHTFTNDCDTTCNDCGHTRTINHSYSTTWSSNATSHWHECSVCKDKKDMSNHNPGAEATENTPQKCTICDYIIQNALGHTHTFGTEFEGDESGHWNVCISCGEKSVLNSHEYDNACDKNCNICDYARETQHTYGNEYEKDATSHWRVCTICSTNEDPSEHNYDNACDEDCNVCSNTRLVEHKYNNGVETVKPTQDKAGEKVYTCEECGTEKKVELELVISSDESNPNNTGEKVVNGIKMYWIIITGIACMAIGMLVGCLISKKKTVKQ